MLAGRAGLGPFVQAQANPIVLENNQAGSPASEWDVSGAGDPSIQGFATDISVNKGDTVSFKVKTDSTNYRIDIYRLGYYGGAGARLVARTCAVGGAAADAAGVPRQRRHRPGRLRQLGRLGVVVDGRARCPASTSPS